ncbi:hypothetical protein ig2599ANME_1849 [groundwater metagenome]
MEVPKNATKTTATAIDAKAEAAAPQSVSATPASVATTAVAAATAPPSAVPAGNGFGEASKQAFPASTTPKMEPGFELVFAMIGLLVVKYLVLHNRR